MISLIKKLLNKFSSKEKITEVALNKNENSSKTNNNKLIQNKIKIFIPFIFAPLFPN